MAGMTRGRALLAAAATVAIATALPGSASALSVTVTGDDGQALPLTAEQTIRNMDPSLGIGLAAGEKLNYAATVAGPDGTAAAIAVSCLSSGTNRSVDYRGNGRYTVQIQRYAADDYSCRTPVGSPSAHAFVINASVAVGQPPAPRVLVRDANSFITRPVTLAVALNPGAIGHELRYALNGAIGPDGAISGPSEEGFVDRTAGTTSLRLSKPGRYVVVARARGTSAAAGGPFSSPWSAPVTVNAVAPFDFERLRVTDSRGPSYAISVKLREPSARGRVSIAYARGTKGGRYRSLGSVRLGSKATFTKRFTLRRSGTYRMRFKYAGGPTVASGTVVEQFRVSRRFAF